MKRISAIFLFAVVLLTAGLAAARSEAGIYTAVGDVQCDGTLRVLDAEQQVVFEYTLQGEEAITFALEADLLVSLPAHCTLRMLDETATYYVNPQGGRYFHSQQDCPSVGTQYQAQMTALTAQQLTEEPYCYLLPCTVCMADQSNAAQAVLTDNPYVFYYHSPYDTADSDLSLAAAGTYSVQAGLYTAESDALCSGTLAVTAADGSPLYAYALTGEASYTFYLGEGMAVTLPAHCTLHALVRHAQFQDDTETVTVRRGRYMTMAEIPGRVYCVTKIAGETGYFVVSSIDAETGLETPVRVGVSDGAIETLDLTERYDVFVEFVNCVVWAAEHSEG